MPRLTHLPVAQQDYPHQHHVDVGPQGLIVVDFIDLKDHQGDAVNGTLRPKDQSWLSLPITSPPTQPTLIPCPHSLHETSPSLAAQPFLPLCCLPRSHHCCGMMATPPQCPPASPGILHLEPAGLGHCPFLGIGPYLHIAFPSRMTQGYIVQRQDRASTASSRNHSHPHLSLFGRGSVQTQHQI